MTELRKQFESEVRLTSKTQIDFLFNTSNVYYILWLEHKISSK